MMLYPSINDLRDKTDSRYTLCILAAKRARDIIDGKPVLTDVDAIRPVSIATNEIAEDLITYSRKHYYEEVVEEERREEEETGMAPEGEEARLVEEAEAKLEAEAGSEAEAADQAEEENAEAESSGETETSEE
jgi:DNA-directed RNA polymerase subunit omega